MKTYAGQKCRGCGIDLADGYTLRLPLAMFELVNTNCNTCRNRRENRLKRDELYTETGIAGEKLCNTTGRIVAA